MILSTTQSRKYSGTISRDHRKVIHDPRSLRKTVIKNEIIFIRTK